MASKDARRSAADARRIAPKGSTKATVGKFREALVANYERGHEAGRAEMAAELGALDTRTTLLRLKADDLERTAEVLAETPNSDRQVSALGEAAAILRDSTEM